MYWIRTAEQEGVSSGIGKYLAKPGRSQHNFTERKHQKTTGKESKEASEMQASILDHLETKTGAEATSITRVTVMKA